MIYYFCHNHKDYLYLCILQTIVNNDLKLLDLTGYFVRFLHVNKKCLVTDNYQFSLSFTKYAIQTTTTLLVKIPE
jgi:hypothetical protein